MDYQSMFTFMLEMAGTIAEHREEWIFSGSAFLAW